MALSKAAMDGFHVAHSIWFHVYGASRQCCPKATLSSTFLQPTSRSRSNFLRPMYSETDSMIPQPDWITFPQTPDSFGFSLGTLNLFLVSANIPDSKKSYSLYQKESTASRKPKLLTQMCLNSPMPIYIFPVPLMIHMPLLSFQ